MVYFPSIINYSKKASDEQDLPIILDKCRESLVVVGSPNSAGRPAAPRSSVHLLFVSLLALVVASAGVLCGVQLYQQFIRSQPLQYHKFCNVAITDFEADGYTAPQWFNDPNQEVEQVDTDQSQMLQEEVDIRDAITKINVLSAPGAIGTLFIVHDFDNNVTAVKTVERCFVMQLDPQRTLAPSVFHERILLGDSFDVNHVRTTMSALIPPRDADSFGSPIVQATCDSLLVFTVVKQNDLLIRKRSVEAPVPADFWHFSGNGVQEIEITNMADVLKYGKH